MLPLLSKLMNKEGRMSVGVSCAVSVLIQVVLLSVCKCRQENVRTLNSTWAFSLARDFRTRRVVKQIDGNFVLFFLLRTNSDDGREDGA